jgi:Putative beta-barrel porin-2, OmpL-like. bbp2
MPDRRKKSGATPSGVNWGLGVYMKKLLWLGTSLVAWAAASNAMAAELPLKAPKSANCDPYVNYSCMDAYLGDDVLTRFYRYYQLEWGHDSAPSDPKAPPGRRAYWPTTPETTPPMPFTEWPYGGATTIGVTRPSSVDGPLMTAIANTSLGGWLNDNHIQVYGWLNAGFNVSTSDTKPGGNWPAAYYYTPNTVQLDQAVVYVERLPDTVQKDHIDWGFRVSGIYGENYRYTTSYGLWSQQLLGHNLTNGYDMPMIYGELFIPWVADGLLLRAGRFISLPDIEAQLAPNNYMYSHSFTYGYDNYTNTGIQATLAVNKNLFLQLGLTVGTEAPIWHASATIPNPFPNQLFPDSTFKKDPGAQPSITGCVRYQTDSGNDNVYLCADAINAGNWGYNNLQWYGGTYYHKFNDHWHISYEAYTLYQRNVPNITDPAGIIANGGTPFSAPGAGILFNSPNLAQCKDPNVIACTAQSVGTVAYINYSPDHFNNFSFRPEFFDDMQGQRTGVKTRYWNFAVGWQHWFSPQIEIRPEVAYYSSVDKPAFNGSVSIPGPNGIQGLAVAPNKFYEVVFASDIIIHF